jgi:hypothetical protein
MNELLTTHKEQLAELLKDGEFFDLYAQVIDMALYKLRHKAGLTQEQAIAVFCAQNLAIKIN